MTEFVKLEARQESPFRSLTMHAPLDEAWEALRVLAAQLPPTFTWSAAPVADLALKSESQ